MKEKLSRIIIFLCILFFSIVIGMGTKGKYYAQFGNVEIKPDKSSGTFHTDYLDLPKGDYQVIIGYRAEDDTALKIRTGMYDRETVNIGASENESFISVPIHVNKGTDLFCIEADEDDVISEEQENNVVQIYEYELVMSQPYNTDFIYFAIVFLVLFAAVSSKYARSFFAKLSRGDAVYLIVLFALVVFISLPTFRNYLVSGHDLSVHLKRIEGLKTAIAEGHFIAAIFPETNNGYGELGFCYPYLYLYFPALLRLCNVSMVAAYNSLLFLINVFTAIICFHSAMEITKSCHCAAITAIAYLLIPYRLSNLYFRAAIGESIGMAFLPLVMAGLYHIIIGDGKRWHLLSIGFIGILGGHILSVLLAGLMSMAISLLNLPRLIRDRRWLGMVKAAALFMMAALPYGLMYLRFIGHISMGAIAQDDFYEYSLYPGQLFMTNASDWVMEKLPMGIDAELTQGVGLIGGLILVVAIYYVLYERRLDNTHNKGFTTSLCVFSMVAIFATMYICPWNVLPEGGMVRRILSMIQFPSRFLSIASAALVIVLTLALDNVLRMPKYKLAVFCVVTCVGVIGAFNIIDTSLMAKPWFNDIDGGYSQQYLKEYCPEGTDSQMFADNEIFAENALLDGIYRNGTTTEFDYERIDDHGDVYFRLPILYYPGYVAYDDGSKCRVEKDDDNRLMIFIGDSDSGHVRVGYSLLHAAIGR